MKGAENNYRSQLGDDPLSSLMKIIIDGKPYAEHDSTKVVKVFLQQQKMEKHLRRTKKILQPEYE